MQGEASTMYRGVRVSVSINDYAGVSDGDEEYVEVEVTIDGKRIAGKRTDGTAYGPSYTAVVKADPKGSA